MPIRLTSSAPKAGSARNQGIIAGGINGVNIDANGQLLNNTARIESLWSDQYKTNGALSNVTGDITSVGTIALDTNKTASTTAVQATFRQWETSMLIAAPLITPTAKWRRQACWLRIPTGNTFNQLR